MFKLKNNAQPEPTALTDYIQRAAAITTSPTYHMTNMRLADEFAADRDTFITAHKANLCIPPDFQLSLENSFMALVAPSLEGKTQTAFTLTSALPLYFVLTAAKIGENGIQEIYQPFIDHSLYLQGMAFTDLGNIDFKATADDLAPSTATLLNSYRDEPLLVLGFFKGIIEQGIAAKRSSPPSQFNWMRFYARNLQPIEVTKISISGFKDFLKIVGEAGEKFCVFLDEFLSRDWSIYVRNLVRAVGLVCIVSNTNTNITNLVSKGAAGSREGDARDSCWCLAFRRLDNVDKVVIDISSKLNSVANRCLHLNEVGVIFDKLFNDWFYKSRPGIAISIAEALDLFAEITSNEDAETKFSLGNILQFLIKYVSDQLSRRKPRMISRLNGQVAKLGLLTDAACALLQIPSPNLEPFEPFKYIQFLENHLFYLLNPTGSALDYFITVRPSDIDGCMRLVTKVQEDSAEVDLINWNKQLTAFRNDELFTFLTCLCMKLNVSPSFILEHANEQLMAKNLRIAQLSNSNAVKLSGNNLEVAAAMICADASHHTSELVPIYSLAGQDGYTWLSNIVANCSFSLNFRGNSLEINDRTSKTPFDLKNWLESLQIPFIYGINNPNSMLDELSSTRKTGIFARNYERTQDKLSIDGRFEIYTPGGLEECTVECKNYSESIGAHEVSKLIQKAINASESGQLSKLLLVFTNELKQPAAVSALMETCINEKINLYRLYRKPEMIEDSLKLVVVLEPYHNEWALLEHPDSVGIVLELDQIN